MLLYMHGSICSRCSKYRRITFFIMAFSCMTLQAIATATSQIQSRHIHTSYRTWRARCARCRQYNGISLTKYANTSFNRLGRGGNVIFFTPYRLNIPFGNKNIQLGFEPAPAGQAPSTRRCGCSFATPPVPLCQRSTICHSAYNTGWRGASSACAGSCPLKITAAQMRYKNELKIHYFRPVSVT